MGSVRYIGSTQKRGRASTILPLFPSFSRVISFLSMASLFVCTPCTLSDASCSADQRDFCLKHDLSLKYLKPDYLWVCHLGRRDVTPAGQWQDPPLLSSLPLFFRQERRAYAGEIPRLWILSTNVKRSLVLSAPLCPTPFRPFSSTKSTPRMQRNLTRSLYNSRYSFIIWTHFPSRAIEGSGLFFSFSLFFSFMLHVLTKVLSTVIATTIWILEQYKARSKSE